MSAYGLTLIVTAHSRVPLGGFQYKGDLQNHFVRDDLIVLNRYLLLLDPRALNVTKSLRRSGDTLDNRILETLIGCRADLNDARNGHDAAPYRVNPTSSQFATAGSCAL